MCRSVLQGGKLEKGKNNAGTSPAHLHHNAQLLLIDRGNGPCHLVSPTIGDYIS